LDISVEVAWNDVVWTATGAPTGCQKQKNQWERRDTTGGGCDVRYRCNGLSSATGCIFLTGWNRACCRNWKLHCLRSTYIRAPAKMREMRG